MIPCAINSATVFSDTYKEIFDRGHLHLVCLAREYHPLFEHFIGKDQPVWHHINYMCSRVNEERVPASFYESHGIPLTILPQLQHCWVEKGRARSRNEYHSRALVSRCIREVFRLNREVVHAFTVMVVFESAGYNNDLGIEVLCHHATAAATRKDDSLWEVLYFDSNEEEINGFL